MQTILMARTAAKHLSVLLIVLSSTQVLAHTNLKSSELASSQAVDSAAATQSSSLDTSMFSGQDHPAAKVVLDFHAALKAGDANAVSQLLASDVFIFEGGGVERSKAEYKSHHMAADMAFLKDMEVKLLEHHVRVNGDSALSLSRSKVSGQFKGKPIDHIGMETITLQQRDGHWQITHIHWSK